MKNENEELKPFVTAMIPLFCPDLEMLFPGKNGIQVDRARAILQYMFMQYHIYMLNNPNYASYLKREEHYCFLDAKKLQKIGKRTYKKIITTLVENKIIQVNAHPTTGTEHYRPGRAKEYRIHPALRQEAEAAGGATYRIEKIKNPTVISIIKKMYDGQYPNQIKKVCRINPVYKDVIAFTDSLTLDLGAIEQDIVSGKLHDPNNTIYGTAASFSNGLTRFVNYNELSGRLFHHLCNLPSKLRNYLIHPEGESLVELDICNSHQWVLGNFLINPTVFIGQVPEFEPIGGVISGYAHCNDVKRFVYVSSRGEFISNWLFATGVIPTLNSPYTKVQKDTAKELIFRHIFFGSPDNHYVTGTTESEERFKTELCFKTEYPNVHEALSKLKRTKAKTLPFVKNTIRSDGKKGTMKSTPSVMLMRAEAHLVYKIIVPELFAAGIQLTTIHDSFLISSNDQKRAEEIIASVIQKLGIASVTLRATALNGTNINIATGKQH